jgi:hypothetical protein
VATRGAKLVGENFGELTVEAEAGRSHVGILWLCRCVCGRPALRTTVALNRAKRYGHVPCCIVCQRELRGGIFIARHQAHIEAWRWLWECHRTLWSTSAIDRLTQAIRDEVFQDVDVASPSVLPVEVMPCAETEARGGPWRKRRALFRVGLRFGKHAARYVRGRCRGDDMTLAAIGRTMDLSQERVRQLIFSALEKVRVAWVKMHPGDARLDAKLDAIESAKERFRVQRAINEARAKAERDRARSHVDAQHEAASLEAAKLAGEQDAQRYVALLIKEKGSAQEARRYIESLLRKAG